MKRPLGIVVLLCGALALPGCALFYGWLFGKIFKKKLVVANASVSEQEIVAVRLYDQATLALRCTFDVSIAPGEAACLREIDDGTYAATAVYADGTRTMTSCPVDAVSWAEEEEETSVAFDDAEGFDLVGSDADGP